MMQVALAGTGILLSDGATNVLPIAAHAGTRIPPRSAENRAVVHRDWKIHYETCATRLARASTRAGTFTLPNFPPRYAALYTFFLESLDAPPSASAISWKTPPRPPSSAKSSTMPPPARACSTTSARAVLCGAVPEEEAERLTGLSVDELHGGSFSRIVQQRTGK